MSAVPDFTKSLLGSQSVRPMFSICTLMTDESLYAEMVNSFVDGGFIPADCEYLYIDNTQRNVVDAYAGYRHFLNEAAGEVLILCHQDVELLSDDRACLEARLGELEDLAPDWGVCGNAGGVGLGLYSIRISDPHGANRSVGSFPSRVVALDENFLVVKRSANLAISRDLSGFHLYGADLCVIADILGYTCWVIDFHLLHKSGGIVDANYTASRARFIRKWRRALRGRWVVTTCSSFLISRLPVSTSIDNRLAVRLLREYRRRQAISSQRHTA